MQSNKFGTKQTEISSFQYVLKIWNSFSLISQSHCTLRSPSQSEIPAHTYPMQILLLIAHYVHDLQYIWNSQVLKWIDALFTDLCSHIGISTNIAYQTNDILWSYIFDSAQTTYIFYWLCLSYCWCYFSMYWKHVAYMNKLLGALYPVHEYEQTLSKNFEMSRKAKYEYAKLKSKTLGQQNLYIRSLSAPSSDYMRP